MRVKDLALGVAVLASLYGFELTGRNGTAQTWWRAAYGKRVDVGALTCAGDCNTAGQVTVDEVLTLVNIALANAPVADCGAGDVNHDSQITVDEVLSAVSNALNGCSTAVTATPTATGTLAATPTATATPEAMLAVAEAVARDSHGVALRLNQTVTTDGIVTVAAGVFANKKLKIFIQSGTAGVMVYHQDAGSVSRVFQPGDWIRVTGKIVQTDPGGESVLTGTVMVDISAGFWTLLSSGNPVPAPQATILSQITANGTAYVGTLVSLAHVQKVAGAWPLLGSQSTSVTVSDDGGTTPLTLRFQKNTISQQLVNKLNSIGTGTFGLVGIAVQNAPSATGDLLSDFEVWMRGAEDISPTP